MGGAGGGGHFSGVNSLAQLGKNERFFSPVAFILNETLGFARYLLSPTISKASKYKLTIRLRLAP